MCKAEWEPDSKRRPYLLEPLNLQTLFPRKLTLKHITVSDCEQNGELETAAASVAHQLTPLFKYFYPRRKTVELHTTFTSRKRHHFMHEYYNKFRCLRIFF